MNNIQDIILRIGEQRICAYCGKPISPDKYNTYRCNCTDAQTAYKLLNEALYMEIEAANKRTQIPKTRFGLKTVCAPIDSFDIDEDDSPDPCI